VVVKKIGVGLDVDLWALVLLMSVTSQATNRYSQK